MGNNVIALGNEQPVATDTCAGVNGIFFSGSIPVNHAQWLPWEERLGAREEVPSFHFNPLSSVCHSNHASMLLSCFSMSAEIIWAAGLHGSFFFSLSSFCIRKINFQKCIIKKRICHCLMVPDSLGN